MEEKRDTLYLSVWLEGSEQGRKESRLLFGLMSDLSLLMNVRELAFCLYVLYQPCFYLMPHPLLTASVSYLTETFSFLS